LAAAEILQYLSMNLQMEYKICDAEGMLSICVSYMTDESILGELGASDAYYLLCWKQKEQF